MNGGLTLYMLYYGKIIQISGPFVTGREKLVLKTGVGLVLLTATDIRNIFDALVMESEINDEFRAIVLFDIERAIKIIVYRDFQLDIQTKYEYSKSAIDTQKKLYPNLCNGRIQNRQLVELV